MYICQIRPAIPHRNVLYLLYAPRFDQKQPIMTRKNTDTSYHSRFPAWPGKIVSFYLEGFRSMTVGRKLWLLILIKLFIIFFVFKLFFFPDLLSRDYDNDTDRAEAVRTTLLNR